MYVQLSIKEVKWAKWQGPYLENIFILDEYCILKHIGVSVFIPKRSLCRQVYEDFYYYSKKHKWRKILQSRVMTHAKFKRQFTVRCCSDVSVCRFILFSSCTGPLSWVWCIETYMDRMICWGNTHTVSLFSWCAQRMEDLLRVIHLLTLYPCQSDWVFLQRNTAYVDLNQSSMQWVTWISEYISNWKELCTAWRKYNLNVLWDQRITGKRKSILWWQAVRV